MRNALLVDALSLALIAALLSLAGCAGRRESTEQLAPDELAPTESEKAFELQRADTPERKTAEPIVFQASQPMIPLGIADRVLPEDFAIGSLQDTAPSESRDAAVLAILTVFAEKLLKSEVHADSFDEERKMLLSNSLQYYVENRMMPDDIRFGIIRYDASGNGYLAVRLFTDKGRSTGEIFLGRRDGQWYITDLQLDLQTLTKEYESGGDRYLPSRYRSVLKLF